MVNIIYREACGKEHTFQLVNGMSVMQGAVDNNLPGIDADCGGFCACATCHVYVDEHWADKIEPPAESESAMLDYAVNVQDNSRLACQIKVNERLEGLSVQLLESQQG